MRTMLDIAYLVLLIAFLTATTANEIPAWKLFDHDVYFKVVDPFEVCIVLGGGSPTIA